MIEAISLYNTELDQTVNINMHNGEYWLEGVDFGTAEGIQHTYKYINQNGESVYSINLNTRQIQITGWVASWNEYDVSRMKDRLNHLINPTHLIDCIVGDKKIQFYPMASIQYDKEHDGNCEVICHFLITGYCPYPLFTDKDTQNVRVAFTDSRWHFPWVIPSSGFVFGVRQPTLIAEVENKGDFPIGYVIEIRASGQVVNPILTDIGSQQYIELNKTMEAGEVITIDTREGMRRIRGMVKDTESNYFHYRTFDSSWLSLEKGMNYIRYNAESGVEFLEVSIKFDPAYLEVET